MCIGKNTRKLCCQLEARIRNLRKHFSYQERAERHFWQERRINDAPFSASSATTTAGYMMD
jgi:hypothetical protein